MYQKYAALSGIIGYEINDYLQAQGMAWYGVVDGAIEYSTRYTIQTLKLQV